MTILDKLYNLYRYAKDDGGDSGGSSSGKGSGGSSSGKGSGGSSSGKGSGGSSSGKGSGGRGNTGSNKGEKASIEHADAIWNSNDLTKTTYGSKENFYSALGLGGSRGEYKGPSAAELGLGGGGFGKGTGGTGGYKGPSAAEIEAAREKEREEARTKATETLTTKTDELGKMSTAGKSTAAREQAYQEAVVMDTFVNAKYEENYKRAMDEAAALGKGTNWAKEQAAKQTQDWIDSGKMQKELDKQIADNKAKGEGALARISEAIERRNDGSLSAENWGLEVNGYVDSLVEAGWMTEEQAEAFVNEELGTERLSGVKVATNQAAQAIAQIAFSQAVTSVVNGALTANPNRMGFNKDITNTLRDIYQNVTTRRGTAWQAKSAMENALNTVGNISDATKALGGIGTTTAAGYGADPNWNSALYGDKPGPFSNTAQDLVDSWAKEDASNTTATPTPSAPTVNTTTPSPTTTKTVTETKTPDLKPTATDTTKTPSINNTPKKDTSLSEPISLPVDNDTSGMFYRGENTKATNIIRDDISGAEDILGENRETYSQIDKDIEKTVQELKNNEGDTSQYDNLVNKNAWNASNFNRTADVQYDNKGYDVNKQTDRDINFGEDPTKPNYYNDNWNYGMDIVSTDIVSDEKLKSFVMGKKPSFEKLVARKICEHSAAK